MTGMYLPQEDKERLHRYKRLKLRFASRQRQADVIHGVRKGNIRGLFPEELDFSITFRGSPVANFIDIVARDLAEGLAPLPQLDCVSGAMKTDADVKRAQTKDRIGDNYWRYSHLEMQMLQAADRYVTYGWVPVFVEPDPDERLPCIRMENPRNAYYELNRKDECTFYAKAWKKSIDELCAQFPECESYIRRDPTTGMQAEGETELEVVRVVDMHCVTMFLPDRGGLRLDYYEHKLSRAPVWIVERPGEDGEPRGQFDDVIWVQVARAIYATLALEGAANAVQAPIAIPDDVDELPVGPNAIIQSQNAKDVHRVDLSLPSAAFAENQLLDQELRVGARYPEARSGNINASVITGKGVEALLGTFDGQIRGAQLVWREALRQITSICFEMDEKWWPNHVKTVTGSVGGESYEFKYTPKKAINGRYDCQISYGFAMGLAPSQSLIAILQLEGAGLIAKGTARENLPMALDAVQEQKRVDVEALRESIKQGLMTVAQSSGQMMAQGQDPLQFVRLMAATTKGIQNGAAIEDAYERALQDLEQAQQAQAQQQAQEAAPGVPGAPQGAPGGPGQQQQGPPGAQPTLQQMIAGFRGNAALPVDQFQIRRSTPTGVA